MILRYTTITPDDVLNPFDTIEEGYADIRPILFNQTFVPEFVVDNDPAGFNVPPNYEGATGTDYAFQFNNGFVSLPHSMINLTTTWTKRERDTTLVRVTAIGRNFRVRAGNASAPIVIQSNEPSGAGPFPILTYTNELTASSALSANWRVYRRHTDTVTDGLLYGILVEFV